MKKRLQQLFMVVVVVVPVLYAVHLWMDLTLGEKAHIKELAGRDKVAAAKAFLFKAEEGYAHDTRLLHDELKKEGDTSLKKRFKETNKGMHYHQRQAGKVHE